MSASRATRSLVVWGATALVAILAPAAHAVPPANDTFASATQVTSLPFQDQVSAADATVEAGEPDPACATFGSANTVWYAFTPASNGVVSIDTGGSSFETIIAVWKGDALPSLQPLACAEGELYTRLSIRGEAGATYRIQVGSVYGAARNLSLRMTSIEAGTLRGTVTEAETGRPIPRSYVVLFDRDIQQSQWILSDGAGDYEFVVREGTYLVYFTDWWGWDSQRPEWYEDARSPGDATPVAVEVNTVVEGIDAALEPACPQFGSVGEKHVIGTSGNDTLTGTPQADVVCGFGGDDTIEGLEGDDVLLGGGGRDVIVGGPGDDEINGGPGPDVVRGNGGHDVIWGTSGKDILRGGLGRDDLMGGGNRDLCHGGPGNDWFSGCEIRRGRP